MSGESDVLQRYRRAAADACAMLDRLLAPAGIAATEIIPDGAGWLVRVIRRSGSVERVDVVPAAAPAGDAVPSRPSFTRGVEPLIRRAGESLFAIASRGSGELRVRRELGAGGLGVAPLDDVERMRLLAGTLVGDTILALQHLGEPADGAGSLEELGRQFRLFVEESARLGVPGDPAVFASAVEQWAPDLARGDRPWKSTSVQEGGSNA